MLAAEKIQWKSEFEEYYRSFIMYDVHVGKNGTTERVAKTEMEMCIIIGNCVFILPFVFFLPVFCCCCCCCSFSFNSNNTQWMHSTKIMLNWYLKQQTDISALLFVCFSGFCGKKRWNGFLAWKCNSNEKKQQKKCRKEAHEIHEPQIHSTCCFLFFASLQTIAIEWHEY